MYNKINKQMSVMLVVLNTEIVKKKMTQYNQLSYNKNAAIFSYSFDILTSLCSVSEVCGRGLQNSTVILG